MRRSQQVIKQDCLKKLLKTVRTTRRISELVGQRLMEVEALVYRFFLFVCGTPMTMTSYADIDKTNSDTGKVPRSSRNKYSQSMWKQLLLPGINELVEVESQF